MIRRLAAFAIGVSLVTATLAWPAAAQPVPNQGMPIGAALSSHREVRTTATGTVHNGRPAIDRTALQTALDQAVAAGVPGVVYLIRSGGSTAVLTSGKADLATGRPMSRSDKFRVASITKTFIATVMLQLQAKGLVDLDAPVSRYLPRLLPDGDTITARHLLGHTSGLYDYAEDPGFTRAHQNQPLRRWRPEQLIRRFSLNHPLNFTPGSDFGYSNTGYLVLGLLIEKITGKPVERVLQQGIFTPLGLADTTMPTGPEIQGRHAHGYSDLGAGPVDVDRFDPSYTWSAGAIVSTVRDIATFYQLLFSARVLPAAQLAQMTQFRDLGDGSGYALGLQQQPYPCTTVRGHTGGGLGFATDAETSLDSQRQVVIFANTDTLPEDAYPAFGRAAELSFC